MITWLKKVLKIQSAQPQTDQRSGMDRRNDVDPRNPQLQSWMRRFWTTFFQDNPDKERRRNADRRSTEVR